MIIGIDASMLAYQGSGVANYTYNLIKKLLLLDKKNEYRLFFSSLKTKKNFTFIDEFKNLGGKIYYYRLPFKFFKIIWQNLNILPIEFFIGKCDLIFFSDFLRPPTLKRTRGITTIHDLTWKIYPQYHTKEVINAHKIKLKKTIKYQDEIIVDSKNTKNDLIELYPQINKNKIHVIYPGIDERFNPKNNKKQIEKIIKKYCPKYSILNTNFLLYVGAIEPRKNLDKAIKIFYKLITNYQLPITHFIIIGKAGWKNEKIFKLVKELNLEDKVFFLGYVKDEDLPYFYSSAKLTIYLSEYEGFGLPPLESLACGTPVIAGDNSSLKETIPQEFLVDVKNEEKILEKIKYFLTNNIKVNFLEVKKNFDWQAKTKEFLKIIESLKID